MRDSLGKTQAAANRLLTAQASGLTQGVCEDVDWVNGLVIVNVGGGSIPMPMIEFAPLVGQKVWVAYLGQQPLCVGLVAKATLGTVVGTPSGGVATVLGDDGVSYTGLPYLGSAPSSTNRVAIAWDLGGIILSGTLSSELVETAPEVPDAPTAEIKTYTFYPTTSGNWTGSGYNSILDPYCSASNIGAYFYGDKIPNSIPDAAEFVAGSLKIYLKEFYNEFPSSKATLGLHNRATKSGDPTPTGEIEIPNCYPNGRWVSLPDSWEDNFRLGTARGVSTEHGGYHKFRRAGVENSGTIVGKWRV